MEANVDAARTSNGDVLKYRVAEAERVARVVEADLTDIARALNELKTDMAVFKSEVRGDLRAYATIARWGFGVLGTIVGGLLLAVTRVLMGVT